MTDGVKRIINGTNECKLTTEGSPYWSAPPDKFAKWRQNLEIISNCTQRLLVQVSIRSEIMPNKWLRSTDNPEIEDRG